MEFENTAPEGVETVTEQEVVEPANETETGSNEQEVAAPVSEQETPKQDSETNAAFQRMRHENKEMQSELEATRAELAELQAQQEARENTFSRLTGRDEDADISALAELTGMSEDEIRAEMEAAAENAKKDLRIQQLEEQINSSEAERLMQQDLETLRKIDPSLKSLEELGDAYVDYVSAGLPPEKAYWAIKAEQRAHQATPPKEIGRVATGTAEKDTFTQAEIDAMSPDQLRANWKKIYNSWGK